MRYTHIVSTAVTFLMILVLSACAAVTPAVRVSPAPEEADTPVPDPTSLPVAETEMAPTEEADENPEEAAPAPQATADPASVAEFRDLDPDDFVDSTTIDNPWMPMSPGTRWVHEGTSLDD